MRDYNRFLNSVLENQLLKSSDIIEEFLIIPQNDFDAKFKSKYKKTTKKIELSEYISLTGTIDAGSYQENSVKSEMLPNIIEKKRKLYINLNTALKDVINEYHNLDTKMNNLSEAFKNISDEYIKNNEEEKYFLKFSNFCKNLANLFSREKKLFKIDMKEYFKYVRTEFDELDKLFQECSYAKIDLQRYQDKTVYYKNTTSLKEIEELQKVEEKIKKGKARICHLLQNRACDEYKRLSNAHKIRFKKTFGDIGKNIIEIYQQEYDNLMKLVKSFENA